MKWLVDTHIHIPRNEVDRDLLKRLKRELTFDNPEYLTRVRMGKSTWKVPNKIEAYKITGDELIIPRGCNRIVKEIFGAVEYDDRRSSGVPLPVIPKLPLRLRDYQDEAVQQMKRKHQGVVIIPCGGGKTAVALDAIRQAQTTTIVMVHTLDLLSLRRELLKMAGMKSMYNMGLTFLFVR